MPLEKRSERPPLSNDELLAMAEQFAERARNDYGNNAYAQAAALISLAGSAVMIARMLVAQTQLMNEGNLPDISVPVESPKGLESE